MNAPENPYDSPRTGAHPSPGPAAGQRTSGFAIASLILSCSAVLFGPLGAVPGIVFGHLARRECRQNPAVTGEGIALAGLILGYVFLCLSLVSLLVWLLVSLGSSPSAPFIYTLF